MTRCIQFPFIVLLVVWRNQSILGSDVDLVVSDATCVGNNVTLKCTINPFTTVPSATWSRNGSNALTTCTSGGPCTQDDLTIDGVKYSFTGGSSGIQVAFQITVVENDIEWICSHNATPYRYTFNVLSTCPISQMSTSLATEGTTCINSIPEFSTITLPTITDSTIKISAYSSSYFNTGSSNMNAHTESTFLYSNTETTYLYTKTEITTSYTSTETTSLNANIETTNSYANTETTDIGASTETYEIEAKTLGIGSNYMSTYQSMFAATAANYTPGSFDTTSQIMNEPFAPPAYSISSYNYNEITVPTVFKTSNFFPQTFSETSIASDFPKYSIFSMTPSPSYIGKSFISSLSTSFSVASFITDTPASVFEISNVSRVNGFSLTTETAQTPVSATIFDSSGKSENSEGVYSSGILSSRNSDMYISEMPSETQLWSTNDIQKVTSDFPSTSFDQHSQLSYKVISSGISEYSENVLQSTSLLSSFYTTEESTEIGSYINTTNMQIFATQSSILTMDTFLFSNHSSLQISTVLPDFGTTWLSTTIDNSKTSSSMITPSSQRTNSDNSFNEIGTSSKDLSFIINSFSESVTSRELLMTILSSEVIGPISTLSTRTIPSGLSEKNKNIIFITTTSAVVTIIVVIVLMIFAKLYMSKYNVKPPKEGDTISWSNKSIPPKAVFPDYSVTGKRIYPLLNTSLTSFKMHPYEHNWDDLV